MEAWVKKLAEDKTFTIKTPTAVAAVRGTTFAVEVDGAGQTVWDLFSGMIEISDYKTATVFLGENQRLVVDASGVTTAPQSIPENVLPPEEPGKIPEEKMKPADRRTDPAKTPIQQEEADKAAGISEPGPESLQQTQSGINPAQELLESAVVSPSSP